MSNKPLDLTMIANLAREMYPRNLTVTHGEIISAVRNSTGHVVANFKRNNVITTVVL